MTLRGSGVMQIGGRWQSRRNCTTRRRCG